ncbi:hypothetical protein [Halomonas sp. KO116]|uniref:hypothetical protein n=1 Tax=Halomonas sp. KO116 TaxID=1504981 RepID=UPI0004E2E086|nr:hypothetical protein [Halomonas sp. KO116]AJY53267.1 hypothetical protein KO116_P200160 [Halomonas sp. KO116]
MKFLNSQLLVTAKRSLLPALAAAALFASPVHAQSGLDAEDELCHVYTENVALSYYLQKHGASKTQVETALNEYFAYTYDNADVTDFLGEVTGPSVGAVGTFPKNLSEAEIASRTDIFDTLCRRNIALFKENGTIHQ